MKCYLCDKVLEDYGNDTPTTKIKLRDDTYIWAHQECQDNAVMDGALE